MGIRLPALHVVTHDRTLASDGWLVSAEAVLEAGGTSIALHVRGPGTSGRRVFDLARHLVPRARRVGAWLIVNDRVDVALATGADGVHLGRRSLPVAAARGLLPTGARVGVSVHGPDQVERAGAEGADYAFVGTIFPTPSHEGLPGMGVNGLRDAAERAGGLPVIAIGGIDVGRAVQAIRAGASGAAVLRGVWSAPDPSRAVGEFVRAIEGAIDG